MANENNLKPFEPGYDARRGIKPKGATHIATRIQNMLDDDEFTTEILRKDGTKITFKGNPAEAIIRTAILKAMGGDNKWAEWLSKNGFGSKQIHEFQNNPIQDILEKYGLEAGDRLASDTKKEITIPMSLNQADELKDALTGVTCKTCGSQGSKHLPSMLDRDGIGDPGHKMEPEQILDKIINETKETQTEEKTTDAGKAQTT